MASLTGFANHIYASALDSRSFFRLMRGLSNCYTAAGASFLEGRVNVTRASDNLAILDGGFYFTKFVGTSTQLVSSAWQNGITETVARVSLFVTNIDLSDLMHQVGAVAYKAIKFSSNAFASAKWLGFYFGAPYLANRVIGFSMCKNAASSIAAVKNLVKPDQQPTNTDPYRNHKKYTFLAIQIFSLCLNGGGLAKGFRLYRPSAWFFALSATGASLAGLANSYFNSIES